MSDSDQKPPSSTKTLTIKRSGGNESTRDPGLSAKRNATGARAHRLARLKVEKQKTERHEQPAEPSEQRRPPRSPGAVRPAGRDAGPARQKSSAPRNRPDNNNAPRTRPEHLRHGRPSDERRPDRSVHTGNTHTNEPQAVSRRQARAQPDRNPYEGLHRAFASCPRGLEEVLAAELNSIGLKAVRAGRAGVHFEGEWISIQKANLYSRLATRILVEVAQRPVNQESDIADLARATRWESWFGPDHTLRVDTSAINSPMKSLQFCNLLVKDGICDRLRDIEGARPSIDTVRPDARVHLFLSDTTATLYLDTSGESLFKRGWRFDKGQAPIRENLAAGLLALTGWKPGTPLLDPFCGSATILIEAAWMALDIAPGINRPFAFERLRHHDALQWQSLRREASDRILTETTAPIIGFEISSETLEMARRNLTRARVPANVVNLLHADACQEECPVAPGLILTNPPYGIRLEAEKDLMTLWASHLKQAYAGWQVGVISADLELPSAMRLKPRRRVPVFNGALDCRLFLFDLVSGGYQK
ncbi:THUMP domain-containing class I SAM-dependent RNA methyltransferase [Orrella marina]|uniref:RNA methyltransferase n=1 Tax=Orrella marina TaxID=2163011 RepID=A0A2R4XIY0_9BURK|nr:THUMP domain-containing protein [Orrella marina]AWB33745.1 RNA methyltransferase [Orrella marina]